MAGSNEGERKAEPGGRALRELADRFAGMIEARAAAPVHLWNPRQCGTIDIRIDRDGAWHHEGVPIAREGLVRLFARILRREADGGYVLVTPVEKLAIRVEDAPFVAVDMAEEAVAGGALLRFVTNLGEVVPLDADHPLRIADDPDAGFVPYLTVRPGLEARLSRRLAGELAGRAESIGGRLGISSGGHFFVIGTEEAA